MKQFLYLIICLPFLLTACDVHEWPDTPESVKFHLRLNYETDMTEWHHLYDGGNVVEQRYGDTYDNHLGYGQIRYVVRAYPILDKQRASNDYIKEFIFTKDIADGYNHEVTLELPDGDYNFMVWSDLQENSRDVRFYNAENFAEITLQGDYKGNTNYRDAFKGNGNISLVADIMEQVPDTLDITMKRPFAKYEFITTDLKEFIDKEIEYLAKVAASRGEVPPSRINTNEYNVVLYFSGYMPSAYNMSSDKPVDSKMGVMFYSKLNVLNENEASLGFDYVFVSDKKSAVTVQLGLYDKEERQIALTDPINVPLQRDHHTILKSSFLMQDASGGIIIDSEFDGEFNIEIK